MFEIFFPRPGRAKFRKLHITLYFPVSTKPVTKPSSSKMAATSTTQNEGQNESSVANTNRVWVGNLAYKSSEEDLKDAFAGLKMLVFHVVMAVY